MNLFINVNFVNDEKAPFKSAGGMLTINRTEVELRVTANKIPESVDIDLSEAQIGDVITSESVQWPEGSKPVIDREFTIAAISAPKTIAADDEEGEEAEADAPAEGGEE